MNDIRLKQDIMGDNLRILRVSKGLTLEEAAVAAGLTKGFLSLVETGRRRISASDLHDLLSVFGYTTAMFISSISGRSPEPETVVQKAKTMLLLDGKSGQNATRVLLARPVELSAEGEICHIRLEPQKMLTTGYISRKGVVRGFVISGVILIEFKGDEAVARAGDEFRFEASKPHLYRNYTDEPTEFIQFVLPT
jgi:transcriptional regulator with XRE-family HTH domain